MERESFEDQGVADYLNNHFVSVKLDREERPDVDHFYMEACVAMTESGGWPLSCFLTHERKPFFAGSYFPKNAFVNLLTRIEALWRGDRPRLLQVGSALTAQLEPGERAYTAKADNTLLHTCYAQLESVFDAAHGGFGQPPKFPMAHTCMFLLRYSLLYRQPHASYMAEFTLDQMARGGLYDHIGGGFCRYSTDRYYLVPHFEKMIYDNAMLALVYAESGRHGIARETLDYCLREMRGEHGGFYTAQDADSEGVEGKYYCFTPDEIQHILGNKDGMLFNVLYDITDHGNFEGTNIPNLLHCPVPPQHAPFASEARVKVREARARRVPPQTDRKQLAGNNGLMLAALATAARLLKEPRYLQAALETAGFILHTCFRDGRLYAGYTGGPMPQKATSDDYAYVAWGLYRLHQATLDRQWLLRAQTIADGLLTLFRAGDGSLYLAGHDVRDLPVRMQSTRDGALPSGNSIAAGLFLRLWHVTGETRYQDAYREIVTALANDAARYPMAHSSLLAALTLELADPVHLTVEGRADAESFIRAASGFHPFLVLDRNEETEGAARAVACVGRSCHAPVTDARQLAKLIAHK